LLNTLLSCDGQLRAPFSGGHPAERLLWPGLSSPVWSPLTKTPQKGPRAPSNSIAPKLPQEAALGHPSSDLAQRSDTLIILPGPWGGKVSPLSPSPTWWSGRCPPEDACADVRTSRELTRPAALISLGASWSWRPAAPFGSGLLFDPF
jgi:hypothetical protein